MTTTPKARKFRIRRGDQTQPQTPSPHASAAQPRPHTAAEDLLAAPATPEDGFGDLAMPGSAAAARREAATLAQRQVASEGRASEPSPSDAAPPPSGRGTAPTPEQEIAGIRAEGLTGRQLRMARRTAQKHGLSPTSDFDAVRLLRARGIDPFSQSNMLELVVDDAHGEQAEPRGANLPATTRPVQTPAPPGPPRPMGADERAAEIMKVQRDIARRRRKRLVLLASRLAFFVSAADASGRLLLLPRGHSALCHQHRIRDPEGRRRRQRRGRPRRAARRHEFRDRAGKHRGAKLPRKPRGHVAARPGSRLPRAFLGFRDRIPCCALPPRRRSRMSYSTYRDQLTIGYDPTEGVVKMEMLAADPTVQPGLFGGPDPLRRRTRRPDEPAPARGPDGRRTRQLRRCGAPRRRGAGAGVGPAGASWGFSRPRPRFRPCSTRSASSRWSCSKSGCAWPKSRRRAVRTPRACRSRRKQHRAPRDGDHAVARRADRSRRRQCIAGTGAIRTADRAGGSRNPADDAGAGPSGDGNRADRGEPPVALPVDRGCFPWLRTRPPIRAPSRTPCLHSWCSRAST